MPVIDNFLTGDALCMEINGMQLPLPVFILLPHWGQMTDPCINEPCYHWFSVILVLPDGNY